MIAADEQSMTVVEILPFELSKFVHFWNFYFPALSEAQASRIWMEKPFSR
jgi:hypothetical protein